MSILDKIEKEMVNGEIALDAYYILKNFGEYTINFWRAAVLRPGVADISKVSREEFIESAVNRNKDDKRDWNAAFAAALYDSLSNTPKVTIKFKTSPIAPGEYGEIFGKEFEILDKKFYKPDIFETQEAKEEWNKDYKAMKERQLKALEEIADIIKNMTDDEKAGLLQKKIDYEKKLWNWYDSRQREKRTAYDQIVALICLWMPEYKNANCKGFERRVIGSLEEGKRNMLSKLEANRDKDCDQMKIKARFKQHEEDIKFWKKRTPANGAAIIKFVVVSQISQIKADLNTPLTQSRQ